MDKERFEELSKMVQHDHMDKIHEVIADIRKNHHKILDDWCKAYMAELYVTGLELSPGMFVLNEQQTLENGMLGYKYWFTLKTDQSE